MPPPRNSSLPAPDAEEKIAVEGEKAARKGEKEKDESARRKEDGEGNDDDPVSEGEDYCMSPTSYPGQAWEPAW